PGASLESGFRPLGREPLAALRGLDDETHVPAAAALLDRIAHRELEGDAPAVDLHDLHVDADLETERRRRQMIDRDVRADRILAGVEVLEQKIAAGVLDVAYHARRRVDHALLAHEADAAALVHRDLAPRRKPYFQRLLHGALYPARSIARLSSAGPAFAGS